MRAVRCLVLAGFTIFACACSNVVNNSSYKESESSQTAKLSSDKYVFYYIDGKSVNAALTQKATLFNDYQLNPGTHEFVMRLKFSNESAVARVSGDSTKCYKARMTFEGGKKYFIDIDLKTNEPVFFTPKPFIGSTFLPLTIISTTQAVERSDKSKTCSK